jgi:hypothetical protein
MKKILWRCLEQLEHLRCSMPKFVIERRILVEKFLATRQDNVYIHSVLRYQKSELFAEELQLRN